LSTEHEDIWGSEGNSGHDQLRNCKTYWGGGMIYHNIDAFKLTNMTNCEIVKLIGGGMIYHNIDAFKLTNMKGKSLFQQFMRKANYTYT
jgi:hypothetical protein